MRTKQKQQDLPTSEGPANRPDSKGGKRKATEEPNRGLRIGANDPCPVHFHNHTWGQCKGNPNNRGTQRGGTGGGATKSSTTTSSSTSTYKKPKTSPPKSDSKVSFNLVAASGKSHTVDHRYGQDLAVNENDTSTQSPPEDESESESEDDEKPAAKRAKTGPESKDDAINVDSESEDDPDNENEPTAIAMVGAQAEANAEANIETVPSKDDDDSVDDDEDSEPEAEAPPAVAMVAAVAEPVVMVAAAPGKRRSRTVRTDNRIQKSFTHDSWFTCPCLEQEEETTTMAMADVVFQQSSSLVAEDRAAVDHLYRKISCSSLIFGPN